MIGNTDKAIAVKTSSGGFNLDLKYYVQKIGSHILILFFLCGIVYGVTSYFYSTDFRPRGDEPHYLVISQTLLKYHSLDIVRNYRNKDYESFFPGNLPPHVAYNTRGQPLPLHGIGGPILWLIPFALFGRAGAIGFITVVSILTILNIYWLLKVLGIRKNYAFLVTVAFALGSPIYIYSHLTFIEPIGALFCIYIARVTLKPERSNIDLMCASVALGILPWLHIRFAQIEAVLFFFLLYRLYQETGHRNLKRYVYYLAPVVTLFLVLEIYSLLVWGSLNPAINEFTSHNVPFERSPIRGLIGITFDQEYGLFANFPYLLFAIPGVLLTLKKRFAMFNLLMIFLFVPYVLVFTSFRDWGGGMCPPGRYILILTPLLSFYVAYALQRANSRILDTLCVVFLLFAFAVGMAYLGSASNGFSDGIGYNFAIRHLGNILHLTFSPTSYFPSLYIHHQRPIFLAWLAGTIILTFLTLTFAWWTQSRARTRYISHS
jgi:hypothetical protein